MGQTIQELKRFFIGAFLPWLEKPLDTICLTMLDSLTSWVLVNKGCSFSFSSVPFGILRIIHVYLNCALSFVLCEFIFAYSKKKKKKKNEYFQ